MKIAPNLLLFSLISGAAYATGSAPFCVFSSGPPQCFYYDVNSCRSAAATLNGMCAPNNQPQQQMQQQPSITVVQPAPHQQYDVGAHIMDGIDAGRRARYEREEHEAKMRVYEAQAQSARNSNSPTQAVPSGVNIDLADKTGAGLANKCQAYLTSVAGGVFANNPTDQAIAMGYCVGYIEGFLGGRSAGPQSGAPQSCAPEGTTAEAYAQSIVRISQLAAQKAPEINSSPQIALTVGALSQSFPCGK